MTPTKQTELRPIANHATLALAGLIPFTHGSGRDSHGNPVPHGDRVIADALHRMVQAGRDAERILAEAEVQR